MRASQRGRAFEGEAGIGQTLPSDGNTIENAGVFVWDIWGQWRPKAFNDKLLLAFNGGTARVQDLATDYADNENWSNNDWSRYFVNSTDLWSVTATIGFDVWENLLARLEYRLDIASSDGGNAIKGPDGTEDGVEQNIFTNNQSTQHTFIVDLTYSF